MNSHLNCHAGTQVNIHCIAGGRATLINFHRHSDGFLTRLGRYRVLSPHVNFRLRGLGALVDALRDHSGVTRLRLTVNRTVPRLPSNGRPITLVMHGLTPLSSTSVRGLGIFFTTHG